MAVSITRIPPPTAQLLDPKTSVTDQYWYDFFSALQQDLKTLRSGSSINGQAITPGFQVPPITTGFAVGANYSSNGAGNNFTLSSWVEAFGTRPTVASFGEGVASGAGSKHGEETLLGILITQPVLVSVLK